MVDFLKLPDNIVDVESLKIVCEKNWHSAATWYFYFMTITIDVPAEKLLRIVRANNNLKAYVENLKPTNEVRDKAYRESEIIDAFIGEVLDKAGK